MADALLILNAGSSSLKFSVFHEGDPPGPLLRGNLEGILTRPRFVARDAAGEVLREHEWPGGTELGHQGAIEFLFGWGRGGALGGRRIAAVGHRVVHGGLKLLRPALVTAEVLAELEALVPLAPLQQPHNLAAIKAVAQHAPQLPQVACFDTAFHRTQPPVAQTFALPRRYAEEGVRRYCFHGLSYEYIASILPGIDTRAAAGRTVVAHLGNGASMCALKAGRSVASTMGFTALDGLPMGTRCGQIDPGVLIYLMQQQGLTLEQLEDLLYHHSGLKGLSGISHDMRDLLASDQPGAKVAIDYFVYRIGRELGSLVAALGGLDALVFTAGIGEHAVEIRARVCRDAAWLGVVLDDQANRRGGPRISTEGQGPAVWVIPTDEELMIARQTLRLIQAETSGAPDDRDRGAPGARM
jgi:acetate kinase